MRYLLSLLSLCALNATTIFAQGPGTPESKVYFSPAPADANRTIVELAPEPQGAFYAEVELLLRWFKPVCAAVPVVSIGDPSNPKPGALGQTGTLVVIGGNPPHKFEFPMTPGLGLTLGWDRGDGAVGLEVSGFVMEQAADSQHFIANANGSPNSYLPYQATDNSYQALPFTIPGVVTGGSESVGSTKIWGIESDLTMPFRVDRGGHVLYGKFLLGGRYLDLTDRVRITNALRPVAEPSSFALAFDQFGTHNRFAGPQVGSTLGLAWCNWSMELTTKLAAGLTHQARTIEGSPLLVSSAAAPLLVPGPFLALPSNIGRETSRRVTLVPEIGVKSRLDLSSSCSLTLGYSLLYWNKVLCPGDQMSPTVNITQLPFRGPVMGGLAPKPLFRHTDYFAQGLEIGVQFRY